MKVLKKGNPQKMGWREEYVCTGGGNGGEGCEAVLLVEQGDLFKTYSYDREGQTTYITFLCPECGSRTDIYCTDYPSRSPELARLLGKIPDYKEWLAPHREALREKQAPQTQRRETTDAPAP